MAKRQIFPGYAIGICIARALAKRDPGFLPELKSSVLALQKTQPHGETTWETLEAFHQALSDPEFF